MFQYFYYFLMHMRSCLSTQDTWSCCCTCVQLLIISYDKRDHDAVSYIDCFSVNLDVFIFLI